MNLRHAEPVAADVGDGLLGEACVEGQRIAHHLAMLRSGEGNGERAITLLVNVAVSHPGNPRPGDG